MDLFVEDNPFSGDSPNVKEFRKHVWNVYRALGRSMPWRDNPDPYWVFVSEVMLQQTQVSRVTRHFQPFVDAFPGFCELGNAPLEEVLRHWQGLGYNRRARYLREGAAIVCRDYSGRLPSDVDALTALPGIGANTAGSIAAFAHNKPTLFIETNIRRVFIHYFFPGEEAVADARILPLVESTLDTTNPREWYWALMDLGAWLSKRVPNPNRRSRHYARQKAFEGSNRQLRGRIMRLVLDAGRVDPEAVAKSAGRPADESLEALEQLVRDGLLLRESDGMYRINPSP